MRHTKKLALYKVQAENWNEPEFAAASNQIEAIDNVSSSYPDITPQRCSVIYLGEVHIGDNGLKSADSIARLTKENEKMKAEANGIVKTLFDAVATLAQQNYFSEWLWMRLDGFDKGNPAAVNTAYISWRLMQEHGVYFAPQGATWGVPTDKETFDKYMHQYEAVWQDYREWCENER